jgi:hypothetical protein
MMRPLSVAALVLVTSCSTQPTATATGNFCSRITDAAVRSAIAPDCTTLEKTISNLEAHGFSTPQTNVQVSILVQSIIGRMLLEGLPGECVIDQLDQLPPEDQTTLIDVLPPASGGFGTTPMAPISDDRGRSLVSSLVHSVPDIRASCTKGT